MSPNKVIPGFEPIIGQQFSIRILQRFLRRAAVPHALLFTGIDGIGKRSTARAIAMALNCSNGAKSVEEGPAAAFDQPCRQCTFCRRAMDAKHPDIIEMAPRKGILRIDQIRALLATLAMKPFSAACRVVIIGEAHTMNREAGNALLKILEEPPKGTILILTARQRSDLLPTIVSRCRHIRFNPLSTDDIAALLAKEKGLDETSSKTLAKAAGGSYTRALNLAQGGWRKRRDWLIRAAGLDRIDHPDRLASTLALVFALELAKDKERVDQDLETMKAWVRDLAVWPFHPQEVINGDRRETLQQVRGHLNDRQLTSMWEVLEKAQKDIAGNANLRLTLDVMALRMAGLQAA